MTAGSFTPGKFKFLLVVATLLILPASLAFGDSITTQVLNIEFPTIGGSITTCNNPTSCGTSEAAGSLANGTASALAQILPEVPNVSGGVNYWEAQALSQLSYNNLVDVPSGAGSTAVISGNVIFTLTISGTETTLGTGGNTSAELLIGPNESFVGSSGSSVALPAGPSTTVEISTPVSSGNSAFSFELVDTATCPGYTVLQMQSGKSCTATADFYDPVTITAAAVYGPDGNLISDASIVSQSGYSPPAFMPEPTPVLLLGTGLLGLMGLKRRRLTV